ncbi:ribonuclease P protein subunit p20 [Rhodnius prolixus]|uniref:ribonuclease P protein subunit p20 n=1 Tax=Rhodnius prolixus TaxID=13249 RepID=UPI003D18ABEA
MAQELSKSVPNQNSFLDYNKRQRYKSDSDHVVKKRVPPRDSKKPGDVYITNKSNFKAQLNECLKKLENSEEITLHGLGAAVTRAVNLALQIEEQLGATHIIDVTTSTLKLLDDLEPLHDSVDPLTQTRSNSSVHIKIFKKTV